MGGGPNFLFHTPPQPKTTWHGPDNKLPWFVRKISQTWGPVYRLYFRSKRRNSPYIFQAVASLPTKACLYSTITCRGLCLNIPAWSSISFPEPAILGKEREALG